MTSLQNTTLQDAATNVQYPPTEIHMAFVELVTQVWPRFMRDLQHPDAQKTAKALTRMVIKPEDCLQPAALKIIRSNLTPFTIARSNRADYAISARVGGAIRRRLHTIRVMMLGMDMSELQRRTVEGCLEEVGRMMIRTAAQLADQGAPVAKRPRSTRPSPVVVVRG